MVSFTDSKQLTWELSLTYGMVEHIKGILNIDLLDPGGGDPPLMTRLCLVSPANIRLFVDMLYLLCEEQCKERGVSQVQFAHCLGPLAIANAYSAFFDEWQLFFQSLGQTEIAEALVIQMSLLAEARRRVINKVRATTLEKVLQSASEKSSGKLPEALELLRGDSP